MSVTMKQLKKLQYADKMKICAYVNKKNQGNLYVPLLGPGDPIHIVIKNKTRSKTVLRITSQVKVARIYINIVACIGKDILMDTLNTNSIGYSSEKIIDRKLRETISCVTSKILLTIFNLLK